MSHEFTQVASILKQIEHSNDSLCCHIGDSDVFAVSESLVSKLRTSGYTAHFASLFTIQPRWLDHFFPQSASNWFARTARCSRQAASEIITQLPVPVHERLNCNAGNPRCILAVAAIAYTKPDFLIYTTSGMDPRGREVLQSSFHELCAGVRAIHVCHLPDPIECQEKCIEHPLMKCISYSTEKTV